ncbi:uncharacterized protein LOC127251687 [Andrographis paniculata]|uniref:uncharacterized protein LOC127251687 n=1 Tax=Andrographis paniculata TaxID=175694 RepID=UPI0021E856A1|nr:uncharacterized protein LOC127251687 [Andrographis paniculata]XP_051131462.1 uncharacterized protein LOC127251687 [Andrographis paniculata]XP_051131463.1 uncharacterized protein LOC127251687 [Andrographis paniculata]
MDPNLFPKTEPNAPRKVRFAPKAPPKGQAKLVLPKPEKLEEDLDDAKTDHLLRRLQETSVAGKVKPEVKAGQRQVTSGVGGSSFTKSFTFSTYKKNQGSSSTGDAAVKEYKEPWDYYSNYPVILPWRRPYSGNPELLDEEEFDEDPQASTYDENDVNPAGELGLFDVSAESTKLFLQLPETLPTVKQSTGARPQMSGNNPTPTSEPGESSSIIEEIPEGLMGKMLVYKSGAVKLKLGNTLFNVSPGLSCTFAQDVTAVNVEEKICCNLGEVQNRVVITPDMDSLIDAESDFL